MHSATLPDGYDGSGSAVTRLAVQTDGKVLVGGYKWVEGSFRLRVIRFTATLSVDTSFGGGDGEVLPDLGGTSEFLEDLAIAGDNGIIVAGEIRPTVRDHAFVAKLDAVSTATTLAGLELSQGSLGTPFATSQTSYSASVANNVKTLTVTPRTTDRNAVVTVNNSATSSGQPSAAISLRPGINIVTIGITAQDGLSTGVYTITITRQRATLARGRTMTARAALRSVDTPLPRGATVRITVAASSRRVCAVSRGRIRGLRKGTCRVAISVKPRPTRAVRKPVTTVKRVRITVS
jgi:hypothetical protein